jgi:hypothetical protein
METLLLENETTADRFPSTDLKASSLLI